MELNAVDCANGQTDCNDIGAFWNWVTYCCPCPLLVNPLSSLTDRRNDLKPPGHTPYFELFLFALLKYPGLANAAELPT